MPADALATEVARASAGMVLIVYYMTVYDMQHAGLLHCEFVLLCNKILDMIQNVNTSFIIFKNISACEELISYLLMHSHYAYKDTNQ